MKTGPRILVIFMLLQVCTHLKAETDSDWRNEIYKVVDNIADKEWFKSLVGEVELADLQTQFKSLLEESKSSTVFGKYIQTGDMNMLEEFLTNFVQKRYKDYVKVGDEAFKMIERHVKGVVRNEMEGTNPIIADVRKVDLETTDKQGPIVIPMQSIASAAALGALALGAALYAIPGVNELTRRADEEAYEEVYWPYPEAEETEDDERSWFGLRKLLDKLPRVSSLFNRGDDDEDAYEDERPLYSEDHASIYPLQELHYKSQNNRGSALSRIQNFFRRPNNEVKRSTPGRKNYDYQFYVEGEPVYEAYYPEFQSFGSNVHGTRSNQFRPVKKVVRRYHHRAQHHNPTRRFDDGGMPHPQQNVLVTQKPPPSVDKEKQKKVEEEYGYITLETLKRLADESLKDIFGQYYKETLERMDKVNEENMVNTFYKTHTVPSSHKTHPHMRPDGHSWIYAHQDEQSYNKPGRMENPRPFFAEDFGENRGHSRPYDSSLKLPDFGEVQYEYEYDGKNFHNDRLIPARNHRHEISAETYISQPSLVENVYQHPNAFDKSGQEFKPSERVDPGKTSNYHHGNQNAGNWNDFKPTPPQAERFRGQAAQNHHRKHPQASASGHHNIRHASGPRPEHQPTEVDYEQDWKPLISNHPRVHFQQRMHAVESPTDGDQTHWNNQNQFDSNRQHEHARGQKEEMIELIISSNDGMQEVYISHPESDINAHPEDSLQERQMDFTENFQKKYGLALREAT